LLELVCDTVVSLDGQLRIMGNASRLAAMAMLPSKSFEGTLLEDLMPVEEDRETLRRCMGESQPCAVHVRLRDCMGGLIRVELFCVRVQQLVGARHLVGIREFSDCAPIPEFKRFEGARRRGAEPTGDASNGAGGEDSAVSASEADSDSAVSGSVTDESQSADESTAAAAPQRKRRPSARSGDDAAPSDHLETSDQAIKLALVRVMRMCRVRGPARRHDCCPFHATAARLRKCLRDLSHQRCLPRFKAPHTVQCGICGLMAEDAGPPRDALCFACVEPLSADRGVLRGPPMSL